MSAHRQGKGAKDLFKIDLCAEQKQEGLCCNVGKSEYWVAFRVAWDGLSAARSQNGWGTCQLANQFAGPGVLLYRCFL